MMRVVWRIAVHEYVTNVRRPGFIFVTLLIPTFGLISLVIAAFFGGQADQFFSSQFAPRIPRSGVVDETRLFTPIPSNMANRFEAYAGEAEARQALVAGHIGAVIVIPADYLETGKVTAYTMGDFGSSVATAESNALRSLLVEGMLAGKVDPQLVQRASRPVDLTLISIDAQGQPSTGGPFNVFSGVLAPYFLSLFLVMSIFISSGYLLRSVSEEKETRVIEIILSSVTATQLLGGKVVGLGALGLTQVAVWLISVFAFSGGIGAMVAGVVVALNPVAFLLAAVYFVLGFLVFGIIMATAGALGTNMRESQQLAGIFSFAAAIPYMIGGFLFTNPNAGIARVLSFFPLTAPTMMMLRLPLGAVPVEDIVGSIIVLLITIPVVLWAGAKIFRMGLLMYGKRPSLREIVRVVRSA